MFNDHGEIGFTLDQALDLARIVSAHPGNCVTEESETFAGGECRVKVYPDADDLRVVIDNDSGNNGLILGEFEPIPEPESAETENE